MILKLFPWLLLSSLFGLNQQNPEQLSNELLERVLIVRFQIIES
jgi:hypothetical protein